MIVLSRKWRHLIVLLYLLLLLVNVICKGIFLVHFLFLNQWLLCVFVILLISINDFLDQLILFFIIILSFSLIFNRNLISFLRNWLIVIYILNRRTPCNYSVHEFIFLQLICFFITLCHWYFRNIYLGNFRLVLGSRYLWLNIKIILSLYLR